MGYSFVHECITNIIDKNNDFKNDNDILILIT